MYILTVDSPSERCDKNYDKSNAGALERGPSNMKLGCFLGIAGAPASFHLPDPHVVLIHPIQVALNVRNLAVLLHDG
jgi:hypothetical protein